MKTTTIKNKELLFPAYGGFNFSKIAFSLLDSNKKVLQSWQTCKDYCNDLLYETFAFNGNPDLGRDKPRFLIKLPNTDVNYEESAGDILDCIHQVEKDLKFKTKTVFYKVKWEEDNTISEDIFCVIGASEWLYSLPLFSLFQTIIRSIRGLHKKGDDYRDTFKNIITKGYIKTDHATDKTYLSSGIFFLQLFIKYGYTKFFYGNGDIEGFKLNWKKSEHGGSSHSGGIYGLYIYIFNSYEGFTYKSFILHKYYARPELLKEIELLEGKKLFPAFIKGEVLAEGEQEIDLGVKSLYK
jgi:hypothetical protein